MYSGMLAPRLNALLDKRLCVVLLLGPNSRFYWTLDTLRIEYFDKSLKFPVTPEQWRTTAAPRVSFTLDYNVFIVSG